MYLFEDLSNISAFTLLAAGCPGSCPSLRACSMSSAVCSCPPSHHPPVPLQRAAGRAPLAPPGRRGLTVPAHTHPKVTSGNQLVSVLSPTWSGRSREWSSRTPGGCGPTAPSPSRASSWCRPPRSAPHLRSPWSCT